jgi:uncharacterized repeat protein (TIGR03943 family)
MARAVVLAAIAAGIGRLATSGAYAAYVRPGMRIPLLVSAVVLFVLALSSAWSVGTPAAHGHDDHDHDHDHGGFPWVGALLLVPIVCIAIVPILPLGSGAVTERRANVLAAGAGSSGTAPSPVTGSGELTLLDFMTRVVTAPDAPFTEPVTVTGFVASTSKADGEFVLGRFVMSCCAADAQPVLVTVRADGRLPRKDAWVEVTGRQVPAPDGLSAEERADPANVVIDATDVRRVPQPEHPYLNA